MDRPKLHEVPIDHLKNPLNPGGEILIIPEGEWAEEINRQYLAGVYILEVDESGKPAHLYRDSVIKN